MREELGETILTVMASFDPTIDENQIVIKPRNEFTSKALSKV